MASSFVTTLLIPAERCSPEGARRPAARSPTSRTSTSAPRSARCTTSATIVILWFAGASAMAGSAEPGAALSAALRHGARMGPRESAAGRDLHGIAFLVTIVFDADVEAQGGAYATGVLVLMRSGGARGRHS